LNENCKLQFRQQFRRFCIQTRHFAREKLDGWVGARNSFWKSSTPWKSNFHQNDYSDDSRNFWIKFGVY